MSKLILKCLVYIKIVFLVITFSSTLYILLIRMEANELSVMSIFSLFIPLLLVLISFVFSFFLNIGKDNILFNLVCLLTLLAIMIIDYRTIFDKNIISNISLNINFFDLEINKIKIMLYLMFISNVLLMIYEKKEKIHS